MPVAHEMKSLMEMSIRLGEMIIAEREALHHGVARAAKIVEAEAKREIGNYQDSAGSLPGWAALADSTVAEKEKLGFAPPDNPLLREGGLRDSIDHKVADLEAAVGSNEDVAVWQELGTARIPPRTFLGGAAFRKADKVVELIGEEAVLALVGQEFRGDVAFSRIIERE